MHACVVDPVNTQNSIQEEKSVAKVQINATRLATVKSASCGEAVPNAGVSAHICMLKPGHSQPFSVTSSASNGEKDK